jgi:hypothetical protein
VSFFFLHLDLDMSAPTSETQGEPSTARLPPRPIRTRLTDPADLLDKTQSPPSAGPEAYDVSVIPPSHDARTIILCFGDQFHADVCAHPYSQCLPHRQSPARRIRTSCSFSRCSKRTMRVSRWSTIRSAEADFRTCEATV